MNIQHILKKKQNSNQDHFKPQFDQKSILYKYHNNGEWKKVQEPKLELQNNKMLEKNHLPRPKPLAASKQYENDRHMFKILYQFQKFIVYNKILGEGSYSKVYLGQNKKTKKFVAIKQVEELQENQIACLMNSQSKFIIKMYHFWNSAKYSYIALQLCQTNLRECLKKLSIQEKIQYFQQIIQGIDYLNKKNIIHRDLKFQNILIKEKTIKISDFGFAKPIGSKLSVISQKCGTPYTMAPQIYFFKGEGKPIYTHKCDIYSLGVILHEMIYLKHPFQYCAQRMQNNKRIQIKKIFGYLDILIDRSLEPEVFRRCNWQQFMQIFSLYKMKKAQQNKEILQVRNKIFANNKASQTKQNKPQRMKLKQEPKQKPQNNKNDILRYKKKLVFVTPIKNKSNSKQLYQISQQKQNLNPKKINQRQNPFDQINLYKEKNESQFHEKNQYKRTNNHFKKDQILSSEQKQKWKFEHDQIGRPKKLSQMIQEQTLSVTRIIGLVMILLIILALAQTPLQ